MKITSEPHPLLDAHVFATEFAAPLAALETPPAVRALLVPGAPAPLAADDTVRAAVRDLLRHGGYKPTGRGKPASEYLVRAVDAGTLASINLAVDVCNAVSLHSGLPISVIDLDRAQEPLGLGVAARGASYVFNAGGQCIDLGGLLCLFDAQGPCANAVKDAQRTKTTPETRRTLSVIWSTRTLGDRGARAREWYGALLAGAGARTESLDPTAG